GEADRRRDEQRLGVHGCAALVLPGPDLDQVCGQCPVEIIAAKEWVAADGQNLVIAKATADDADVECAAAQVVDGGRRGTVRFPPGVVDGGRGRLVEQLADLVAGQFTRLPRRLNLAVIEVGRHGDDGGVEQVVLGQD